MIPLAAIIEQFAPAYLTQYGASVLPSQLQALNAMKLCRSSQGPGMLAQCHDCGQQRVVPHSCGHRNCPHCQHFESQRWIERQTQALVPGSYFLITFTVPAELRPLVWQHQRLLYKALMDCAWGTLCTFSQNHRKLQGSPGAVAVLHTHSRKLDFHPHVHMAMPAAALDADKKIWRTLRKSAKGDGYLFNHEALAKVFKAKFLAVLGELGLPQPCDLPKKWVVDCKGVGNGGPALVYLGRYLYRGVIQEKDILRCENGHVTYRWKNSKTNKIEQRTVSGVEFLRLVLQHVLPKGFRRARNYGFLHPNSRRLIALLRLLVFKTCPKAPSESATATQAERPQLLCRCCGGVMVIMQRRILPFTFEPPGVKANGEGIAGR
ncbi:MAG: transposase [Comamonadaceae bacterium]|nr:MAG: transposase [Comamonadaceae bacterium]